MSDTEKCAIRLPVVVCELNAVDRSHWMEVLKELVRSEYPSLFIDAVPGESYVLERVLDSENGILLVILSVPSSKRNDINESIQMFSSVMQKNRDSYVLLCIHNSDYLTSVLSYCMRPAGIMLAPFEEELIKSQLRRIFNDYIMLCGHADDAEYMVVNSGKNRQRIAYRDILYLEAQDKLLNINLEKSVVTVRSSLNAMEESLPDGFIRCHRSYIVNRIYVDSVSISDMTLRLTTQEKVPISRSYKSSLRTSLQAEGWI